MFIKPCSGIITSLYSDARLNPVLGVVRPHRGTDYGNTPGQNDIVAAASGKVRIAVNSSTGFGKYVVITHDNGWETLYAHLSVISVGAGKTVKQGQKIGVKGTTGNSTGVHLHFEISKGRWSNKYTYHVNPALFIDDPDVRELQQLLNKLGYKVTVDGLYGNGVAMAVLDYQKNNRLGADGVAGRLTMGSLEKSVASVEKPTPPKKEEIRLFKPSSPTLEKSMIDKIEKATKDKVLKDSKWLAQAKAGTLSLDDALALSVYIDSAKSK